jgi:hypothetical protein
MTNERTKRMVAGKRRLVQMLVQYLNEVLYFVSSSMMADNLVLRNQLLCQAPKHFHNL